MAFDTLVLTKTCSKCGEVKPLSSFGKAKGYADGHRGQCTQCRTAYNATWTAQWKKTPKGRRYEENRKQQEKVRQLFNDYGLIEDDYQAILRSQDYRCAICGSDKPGGQWGRFVVDHCHRTGRVRGILCDSCNKRLGRLGDSLDKIAPFVDYLYACTYRSCD